MSKKPTPETPSEEAVRIPDLLAVLPLKDSVVLPYIIVPLSVGRDKSVAAVDHALSDQRVVLLLTQRDANEEDPDEKGLYTVGTAATIMRMLKLPDGRTRILVQGLARVAVDHLSQTTPFFLAKVRRLDETKAAAGLEIEALQRSVKEGLERVAALGRPVSPEVQTVAANLGEPGRLADLVAANIELRVEETQALLEVLDPVERLRRVSDALQREIQVLVMQQEISTQARGEMDKSQREYYLRQQLRAIQQELGEGEELAEEVATYRRLVDEKGIPEDARTEIEKQIRRLERSHPDSAETGVLRTYLDWLTGLPWSSMSEDDLDLVRARKILDEDHFDLEKIKERILEYLAVRKLKPDSKGPILCLVGPPGVGKTSLGRSIARAMGRKFVRISLGGVRDEAEIRGHRRTYVGALPGRIVQGIHQAGTANPVFMLDEIDKLGADYRGDPSSALLEVLDPEQNSTFRDHYLGVAYDLSRVLFITTANLLEPIQPAFLDRMEVLRLSGYTEGEKLEIAKRHVVPKQLLENGLGPERLEIEDPALRRIISRYTREAGLRNLEREIATVCRKVAVRVASGFDGRVVVRASSLPKLLGPEKHLPEELLPQDRVGIATGLAWTAAGGDLLLIEVLAVPGKGALLLTGQLGEVMKESAQAALSYARTYAASHGVAAETFTSNDLHVHVPAGSIPKDGPSAGITIATALVSVLSRRAVRRNVAMTGEITLRGDVLPIGGVKEKVLAARAAGAEVVLLPKLNQRDLLEVTASLRRGLEFRFVSHMDDVLEHALLPPPRKADPRPVRRASLAEEALVAWLRQRTGGSASPIGDDAALLALQGDFAITIDSQEAGVHFPPHLPPKVIARWALAVNLSDLAACGAEPRLAFLALAAPAGFPHRRFLDAFTQACRDAGVELAGGDLSRSDRVRATVCLIGKRQRSGRWPRRSLGRAGDVVWIGGTLGESAAGCRTLERGARWVDARAQLPADWQLEPRVARAARAAIRRHLFPRAQLELGRWLARRPRAAAIDVSDGLAKDLRRLTAASGVGARLDLERIPIPAHLGALARFLECEANDLVLGGGEDYVLLFALPAGQAPPPRFDCRAIGELTRSRALRIRRGGRDLGPLPPLGFDHLQR